MGNSSGKRVILNAVPFVLAALVFVLGRLALRNSGVVEDYYSKGLYPFIARWLSAFSNLFPFSLWDVFWVLIILIILFGLTLVIIKKMKLGKSGLRFLQLLALLYSLFYFVWGFNYFRPPIEKRLKWDTSRSDEAAFRSILDSIIIVTNSSYCTTIASDYSSIDLLVEKSFQKNSSALEISYPNGTRRPKHMLFGPYIAKAGVSGYFGPFFNEIHLNSSLLPMDYAFSLAHEKSHQFGITNEAEANLSAFVICTTSDDKRLQYSGNLCLLLYFLSDASYFKDYNDYVKKINKEVIQDLRYRRKYYTGLENETLDKAQSAVYNTYLKANHVEHGVMNYNQVVALVIDWYHNRLK